MVEIERVLRDEGTTPERFVFFFDDGAAVAVIDVEKLPYHESTARFEASMTQEAFIIDGVEVSFEDVPTELADNFLSSVSESTHAGSENVETVPTKYLTTIQNSI